MYSFSSLARDERLNALLGWLLTAALAVAAVRQFGRGGLLWAGFLLIVVAVTALPPVVARAWTVMVPWPLAALAVAAAAFRASGRYPEVAGYLALAGLALIAVAELDAFTAVEMSRRFAVGFAALTTLALQACWTVAQYYSDRWLGTAFLRSQRELQWDIVAVTVVTLVVAGAFQWYVDRTAHVGSHKRPAVPTDDTG